MSLKTNEFRKTVLKHWEVYGRHQLPWRKTKDPYKILVSEMMLQQTQVERVIPYYKAFLKKYPTVQKLAKSKLSDVLKLWSGLGYNRRGKFLRDAALAIVSKHGGTIPQSYEALRGLPGVGDYTARAVRVFAFNKRDILIETNIRTVYFNHFDMFHYTHDRDTSGTVHDSEIVKFAGSAAKRQDPRIWHWALMDYGAHLKRSGVRVNEKSAHYTKQSLFEGSMRQLRGRLLRRLMDGPIRKNSFKKIDAKNAYSISMALVAMEKEGLVTREKETWRIA